MQCSFPAMDSASHAMVPLTNICILQGATEAKQGVYHKPSSLALVTHLLLEDITCFHFLDIGSHSTPHILYPPLTFPSLPFASSLSVSLTVFRDLTFPQ